MGQVLAWVQDLRQDSYNNALDVQGVIVTVS